MLGVRRFKGVQIDLWCGDTQHFVFDTDKLEPNKHVAIKCQTTDYSAMLETLRQTLSETPLEKLPRRITLITNELEEYRKLQTIFFEKFTDSLN